MKRNVVPLPGSLSTQMRPTVGFDQSFADGETDAGAGCSRGRIGAVELVEQAQLMFWRDARTIVVHRDLDRSRDLVRRNDDWGSVGGVLDRILDQIDQHLRDLDVIEAQQRQIGFDGDGQRVTPGARRQARPHVDDELVDVVPVLLRPQRAPLDPGEIEQIAHHEREPIGLFVDRFQEVLTRLRIPLDRVVEERGGGGLDGGQWRAQIVRDGGEKGRLQLVRLRQRRRLRRLLRSAGRAPGPALPDRRRSSASAGLRPGRLLFRAGPSPPARRRSGPWS